MKKEAKECSKRSEREARKKFRQVKNANSKATIQQEKEAQHQDGSPSYLLPDIVPQKKKKHHYVWQYYLRAWTTNDQLWCQVDGKRFSSGTNGVAYSRGFYRLREMTSEDLVIVDQLIIQKSPPHLREIHKKWILLFQEIFDLKKAYEASGISNAKVENYIKVVINNLEEDLHSSIEQEALQILPLLVDGKEHAFTEPKNFMSVAAFLGFQYMRTPKIMTRSIKAADFSPELKINIEAAWGLMRTMSATNISAALFEQRGTLRATFVDSHQTVDFITSDQPAVNVAAHKKAPEEQATKLVLYYPLSPRKALLLAFDAKNTTVERRSLSAAETLEYNRLMFDMSDRQIYGTREKELIAASNVADPGSASGGW